MKISKLVKLGIIVLGLAIVTRANAVNALTTKLYDGSLNTAFSAQGWFSNIPTSAIQTVSNGVTILDTTNNDGLQAGYARFGVPFGNRTTGYTIRLDIQVLLENHTSSGTADKNADGIADRAGFSIIALGSDRKGVELGFWVSDTTITDRIWAQNDGAQKPPPVGTRFTHTEGTSFNPNDNLTRYDLSFFNSTYSLYTNGDYNSPILTGTIRDYQNEGSPYIVPNFLFIGDNTTSASGSFKVATIEVSNTPIIPVPFEFSPAIGSLGLGVWGLIKYLKK